MCGNIEGVQAAIENGTDVNEETSFGETGLMWALIESQHDVMQVLLHHPQIDVKKLDENGCSALHWAVVSDNHEGMTALLYSE